MEAIVKWMLEDICGSDLFASVAKTMRYNVFKDARFEEAVDIVVTISETILVPVALMLICIYFLLQVIDKMSGENFTWEQLARAMVMLLVGKFLIENGYTILTLLYDIGLELIESLVNIYGTDGGTSISADKAVELYETMKKDAIWGTGWLLDIWYIILMIIPWLLAWAMRLVVKIICYTRMIEILVRAAFSPVAFSDFFQNGLAGSGWRWLKNFFAVCLQGIIIMAITLLYSAILTGVMNDSLYTADGVFDYAVGLFEYIGIYVSLLASAVMLMFRSLSLSKEILGTA